MKSYAFDETETVHAQGRNIGNRCTCQQQQRIYGLPTHIKIVTSQKQKYRTSFNTRQQVINQAYNRKKQNEF